MASILRFLSVRPTHSLLIGRSVRLLFAYFLFYFIFFFLFGPVLMKEEHKAASRRIDLSLFEKAKRQDYTD